MKPRTRPHMRTQELLTRLFDEALASPSGQLFYPCSQSKARYLRINAQSIADKFMRESVLMFTSDDPLYGLGIYYNLRFTATEKGLLIHQTDTPPVNPQSILLRAAFLGGVTMQFTSEKQAIEFRTKLVSKQSRMVETEDYPEIIEGIKLLVISQEGSVVKAIPAHLTIPIVDEAEIKKLLEGVDMKK